MTVKNSQSLLDIAVQTSGSPEAVVALGIENDVSITDVLVTGANLTTVGPVQKEIIRLYLDERRTPATAETVEGLASVSRGIGFWKIGFDFKVQ